MLTELRLENVRRFDSTQLSLCAGWNVFVGDNGAGKTTLLEAAYMLSHGRSFRSGGRTGVQRDGANGYSVFGSFDGNDGSHVRAGLARIDGRLVGRVNGDTVSVGELVRHCAVVCFEPGSHELIAGPSEVRREFLDWGVFHVEQAFLPAWRRYQRALRQRNSLLRTDAGDSEFEAWEWELSSSGELLALHRSEYLSKLSVQVAAFSKKLLPELGEPRLRLSTGWDEGRSLLDELALSRSRDRERCHTTRGPHRADWALRYEYAKRREYYSRGQEKLVALICLLAQAQLHADMRGSWPVFCFDDLASELDAMHQAAVVDVLAAAGAQVLVTGTVLPDCVARQSPGPTVFHVEHGKVDRLI